MFELFVANNRSLLRNIKMLNMDFIEMSMMDYGNNGINRIKLNAIDRWIVHRVV